MYFWSKGLGRRGELNIACGTEKTELRDENIVLHGRTLPPISWQYTMTMTAQDFLDILELGFSKTFLKFLLHPKRIRYAIQLFLLIVKLLLRYVFTPVKSGRETAQVEERKEPTIQSEMKGMERTYINQKGHSSG